MIAYSVSEIRKNWKKVLELVEIEKQHVFITRWGKVVAVIVPIDDAEKFLYKEQENK